MKNNNKIAIVSASLGIGGAERFAGLLSFMLTDLGYEVHHIIVLDHVDYDFKGTLVNLGKLFPNEKGIFRAVKKGKYIAQYLASNTIETIIDNRSRPIFIREVFTKWIYGSRHTYFMVHSSNLDMYFSKFNKYLYSNATKIVCVSKEIENKIQEKYGLENTITLYNPVVFPDGIAQNPIGFLENYILFFGRLDEEIKNFTLLLSAYKLSKVYQTGTKLLVIGDGPDKALIDSKIKQLQLEASVAMLPFQKDITPYIQNSKFAILTSRFEGFPMSLLESLASGTPVVSVDCETGPSEIVFNRLNGLLVPNHDEDALSRAIIEMISNEELYKTCKNNAKQSVEHLSLENISQLWKQLLAQK